MRVRVNASSMELSKQRDALTKEQTEILNQRMSVLAEQAKLRETLTASVASIMLCVFKLTTMMCGLMADGCAIGRSHRR